MITVRIDETKPQGRRILKELAQNPAIGSIKNPHIERDENGVPVGHTVKEFFDDLEKKS